MIQQGTIVWEICSSVLLTKMIFKNSTKVIMTHFRPKQVALFPEIGQVKNFYHHPPA